MSHGKKIRNRRRAAVLAGSVAVIAAAVACVPALTHHQALPAPATSHVRVTVSPPGPHSPAGTIASGLIGTEPWDVRVQAPGTRNCLVTGSGLGEFECSVAGPQAGATDPIGFSGMSEGDGANQYFVNFGPVRKDVASVRVVLADGTVLTPRPATVHGTRWVAFANPVSLRVDSVTAYSAAGEIATAIPFNGPRGDSLPSFSAWLRPGQAVPGRVSAMIGSGTVDGKAWRVSVYRGPWGTCIEGDGTGTCFSGTHGLGTSLIGGGGPEWWGTAGSVSEVRIILKDGSTRRVAVVAVGSQKFWAFCLAKQEQKGARWAAYDAAGKSVASGPVS